MTGLKVEPGISGVDVLKRLQDAAPAGTFSASHLRTVQRSLESWRADAVRQWIDQCRWELDQIEHEGLDAKTLPASN